MTTSTVSIPSLHSAAMLCYVQIGVWTARKLDKKQSQKTVSDANATAGAANVNKHLLANADELLKAVKRKGDEIRDYVHANTLPWDDAGNRILSNDMSLIVVGKLAELEEQFKAAVDEFVQEYPALRAIALQNLGEMGDESEYPQPDVVRSKFHCKVSFNPLPSGFGDIRVGMSEQQAKAWQAHFEGNVKSQVNGALRNAWDRLRESLSHYSDRLRLDESNEKTQKFRDSMVENMRQTVTLLTSLNIFGDPELQRITDKVRLEIASYEPAQLRNSVATAMVVKDNVDHLLAHINNLLGE